MNNQAIDAPKPKTKGPFVLIQAESGGWVIEAQPQYDGLCPKLLGCFTDDEDMIDGLERLIGPTDAELEAMDQAWEAQNERFLAEQHAEWEDDQAEQDLRDTIEEAVAEAFHAWMSHPNVDPLKDDRMVAVRDEDGNMSFKPVHPDPLEEADAADAARETERDDFIKVLQAVGTGPHAAEVRAEDVNVRKVFKGFKDDEHHDPYPATTRKVFKGHKLEEPVLPPRQAAFVPQT